MKIQFEKLSSINGKVSEFNTAALMIYKFVYDIVYQNLVPVENV